MPEPSVRNASKVLTARDAVADIADGSSIAVGGFGICGTPRELIRALLVAGPRDLHVVSNNCGLDGDGLGLLLETGQLRKVTCSYIGENEEFARQVSAGKVEIELVPQGTLAERLRLGGSGIPAFYTPTGIGTAVAEGGLPVRYHADGSLAEVSGPKEVRRFRDLECVLEESIRCDFSFVRAWRADLARNLVFRRAAQNFNPVCAIAGRIAIAEAEELILADGLLDPDSVHLPGVFISRLIAVTNADKPIEKLVTRELDLPSGQAAHALD